MDGEHATIERNGAVRSGHKGSHMTAPRQRIEVITRGERRRRWSIEEKREIVAESLGTGVRPSEVIHKHGITSGPLQAPNNGTSRRTIRQTCRNEDLHVLAVFSVHRQVSLSWRSAGAAVALVWEKLNGTAHLKVLAGEAMHPVLGRLVQLGLPFGPKPRLVLVHVNAEALRTNSPEVEIEDSLTAFVRRLKLDPGGRNMPTIKDQLARLFGGVASPRHDPRRTCRLTSPRTPEPSPSSLPLRSWYTDETYIRVHGGWKYLYRAIDRDGALVDVMLSEHRKLAAAKRRLSISKGRHRRDPRPGHDGRPRRLSAGDPVGTR
jgi:DDE domain/Plasmid encoded RepA protein/Transposase